MKRLSIFLATAFGVADMNAQQRSGYALPDDATDINVVTPVVTPGYMVQLTEGGKIPCAQGYTCGNGSKLKSIAGYTVIHYFDAGKEMMKQTIQAYKSVGGFINEVRSEYDMINAATTPGFVTKTELTSEGNTVYYFVKKKCALNDTTVSTALFYFVRIMEDSLFGTIQINIYDGNTDNAKNYADQIIRKLKNLDFKTI